MELANWIQRRIICRIQGHKWMRISKPTRTCITSSQFGEYRPPEKVTYECQRCEVRKICIEDEIK